jgi:histone acetyltransferase (RNA polymerase elongator complex component)
LKQTGYKVVVHLMPDLPGSSPECDLEMFKRAIEDPEVQFDDVKIYPTAVTKTFDDNLILYSKIADDYEKGLYKPYAENNLNDLVNVLKYYLSNVRPWVRIQRLVRDIPTNSMTAGYCKKVNLRQIIMDKMKTNNERCLEIRNMEVKDGEYINYPAILVVRRYIASGGIEYHLSFEAYDNLSRYNYLVFRVHQFLTWLIKGRCIYWDGSDNFKAVFGFLRLRFDPDPGGDICPEINNCALIREVHVYGRSLGIGNDYHSAQHRGYGKKLINAAENISYQAGYKKTAVIAGIGTKQYYQYKNGYSKSGTFMVKELEDPNKNLTYYRIFLGFIILFISFIDHFI